MLLSVKSLIKDTSYHSNQRENYFPSYLMHTSPPKNNENISDKTRKHGKVTLLRIPNITLDDLFTEITKGMCL